jgi:hypothetical protein
MPKVHTILLDEKQAAYLRKKGWLVEESGGIVKKLFSILPSLWPPVARFLRVVGAAALAAGIAAAITAVKTLPIDNTQVILALTAGLVAVDKWLRDRGVY